MTLASSSRSQMRYLLEAAFGTINTGNPTNLRMTGESLSYGITSETSKEIRADRMTSGSTHVDADATGGVNVEMSYREYDPLLEALLASTFSTFGTNGVQAITGTLTASVSGKTFTASAASGLDALAKGQYFTMAGTTNNNAVFKVSETVAATTTVITTDDTTPPLADEVTATDVASVSSTRLTNGILALKHFTLEKEFADVTQFLALRGMTPTKLGLSFAPGSILGGSFDFVGKDALLDSATNYPTGIGSAVASQTYAIMNSVAGVGNVAIDGAALAGTFLSKLDLNVDAKIRAQKAIGVLGNAGVAPGTFEISGTAEIYFNDGALYSTALANTPITLQWYCKDDLNNGYAFQMPAVSLSVPEIVAGAMDQDVILKFDFKAHAGGLLDKMIIVDRFGDAIV